jgi:hypothetical protein
MELRLLRSTAFSKAATLLLKEYCLAILGVAMDTTLYLEKLNIT